MIPKVWGLLILADNRVAFMQVKSDLAIRTQNLTCDFGDVRAVNKMTLEVQAGSVFGFLGPNGAGKTTTIRLLLGLLELSGGTAEVLGFDTRTTATRFAGMQELYSSIPVSMSG